MNKAGLLFAVVMLAFGLAIGYWLANEGAAPESSSSIENSASKREPLFYRNPMNPEITSPVPAQDEMGMDYIPVYADDMNQTATVPGTVSIDPVTLQNMGVRTAVVEQRPIAHIVRAPGRVTFDEERLAMIHPRVEGWVQTLYVNRTGDQVASDAPLLDIYAPQLVTTQQEYLLALANLEYQRASPYPDIRNGAESLVRSARRRLELLDVPEHQIEELERTRKVKDTIHIHSPARGVVLSVGVREGQFVTPRNELYKIADLSSIWVIADIYEYELPWVGLGAKATMELESLPGRIFEGTVSYIYPYLESRTRTVEVRLEFENPDQALKPDTFATVTLQSIHDIDAIVVPSESVIRSGTRNAVFIEMGDGVFEPREVTLGVVADGDTQILNGVSAGERVVTSGQFLIDSESSLREAMSKLMGNGGEAP